jgi:subtilisin family serine protease
VHRPRALAAGLAVLAVGLTLAGKVTAEASTAPPPIAEVRGAGAAGVIPGAYVVVLKSPSAGVRAASTGVDAAAVGLAAARARAAGSRVDRQFTGALPGYAARLDAGQLATVRRDPAVAWVEADRRVSVAATQTDPTWGLDRVDQRNRPLNGTYEYAGTGSGVTVYVVDTGVRANHAQFGGRVTAGYSAIADGRGTNDCNGHGTHVAGTIGAARYGVAKGVRIVPVRVLDCSGSGTTSGVIAGLDWVTANRSGPSVANLSLGGGVSDALDAAVSRAITAGVTFAVAAGNSNVNACGASPARVAAAITVGATNTDDTRASYSNWGSCVDLFAPGTGVTSTWHTSTTATSTLNGTSMATPHAAGVAALYLAANRSASPATVRNALVGGATSAVVRNAGTGSPTRLLYSRLTAGSSPSPSATATATASPSATATRTPSPTVTATPAPTSTTGSCAGATATWSGTLGGPGAGAVQPNGTYYSATAAGLHAGCLTGPAGTDFDLYLSRWNGAAWEVVAASAGAGSSESVSYSGAPGAYYWLVTSYAGSGVYTLRTARP